MHVHVLKFVIIIIIDLIIVCLAHNNYYIDAWYCYEVISLIQHTALIGLV